MTQPLSKSVDNHPVELSVVSKLKNPENDLKQLVINIDQDGGFFVSGKLHSMSAVSNLIDRKLEKVSAARLNILLRVDKRTRTETINEFMTMLERRGIKQVRVSARSEN